MAQLSLAAKYKAASSGYAVGKLRALDLTQSDFVLGFMTKCAEDGYAAEHVMAQLYKAATVHPAIAEELQKCGLAKLTGGFGVPGNLPAAVNELTSPKYNPAPAAPTPTPVPAPASPLTAPSMANPAVHRYAARPTTYKPVAAPQGNLQRLWAGLSGASLAAGSGATSLMASPVHGGAIMTDKLGLTSGAGDSMTAFRKSLHDKGMSGVRDAAPARFFPPRADGQSHQTAYGDQDAERMRNQNSGMIADMTQFADKAHRILTPAAITGGLVSRGLFGNPLANVMNKSLTPALTPAVTAETPRQVANWTLNPTTVEQVGTGASRLMAAETVAQPVANAFAGYDRNGAPNIPVSPTGAISAVQSNLMPKPQQSPVVAQKPLPDSALPPSPEPAGEASPTADTPITAAGRTAPVTAGWQDNEAVASHMQTINKVAQENPEAAAAEAAKHGENIVLVAKKPEGQTEINAVTNTGTLTPAGEPVAQQQLAKEGFDWDTQKAIYDKMDGWEKFALWGGLGLTAIGLIQAVSGGGIGSWLTALLGAGATAGVAANAGMLGNDAQQFTQKAIGSAKGLMGMGAAAGATAPGATTSAKTPGADAGAAANTSVNPLLWAAAKAAIMTPPAAAIPAMQMFAQKHPQEAALLDQAVGYGSAGNAAMATFSSIRGGFGGQGPEDMVSQRLGITPAEAQELMSRWYTMRTQQKG